MVAWRRIAFACAVCSPAVFVAGTLATAVETQISGVAPPPKPPALQLAMGYQDGPTPPTAKELEKVSPEVGAEELPNFTEEYLNDPANIAAGKEIWTGTCATCHGARAYPGKAPKLKPKKYTPDFIFHQATYGGKKMPPFGDVFTHAERMAVAAWIKSKVFAP